MAEFFDKVRAIVFDKGTKTSKIEKLQSELGCTAYEAQTFYRQLQPLIITAARPASSARLRFTIGVEIECFNIDKEAVKAAIEARGLKAYTTGYNHNDSKEYYKLGYDSSIGGNNSCEVVSPILKNLSSLKEVCEVINEAGAQVNKTCGLHVHFGASKFSLKDWLKIISNYAAIEPIIDSFMPISRRGNNNHYCASIINSARIIREYIDNGSTLAPASIQDIQNIFGTRFMKLNVMAYRTHKTIEFRQHSGTTDFEKIENWVSFLTYFLDWSIKHDETITATTIDELPFLPQSLKSYYNNRKSELCA